MNVATEGAHGLLGRPDAGYETEWGSLRREQCNLLLEGPEEVTDAVLLLLRPHLQAPILWKRRRAPLDLPAGKGGTLILQDVATLGTDEQRRVLKWLDETRQPTIVSTTTIPLFPLVAGGFFDSALYYRLNVMLLHVDTNTVATMRTDQRGARLPALSAARLGEGPG
jgi:Sigma-54 interaction domain